MFDFTNPVSSHSAIPLQATAQVETPPPSPIPSSPANMQVLTYLLLFLGTILITTLLPWAMERWSRRYFDRMETEGG